MPTSYWLKFGNSTCGYNGKGVGWEPPIVLPPYTIRLKFTDGITPTFAKGTGTQVSPSPNVWDLTYVNTDWESLLTSQVNLLEVVAANTTGVTNMGGMFSGCTSLSRMVSLDTSSVISMNSFLLGAGSLAELPPLDLSSCLQTRGMCHECYSLVTIPSLDLSHVSDMVDMFSYATALEYLPDFVCSSCANMSSFCYGCTSLKEIPQITVSSGLSDVHSAFRNCRAVESGALAFYQQASQYATTYWDCFRECGNEAPASAPIYAEMQQIPSSWK